MNPNLTPPATDALTGVLFALAVAFIFLSPFLLLVFAWIMGSINERRHYASIHEREAATVHLPAVTLRTTLSHRPVSDARLVTGHVVISIDRFKQLRSLWRSIIGGRVRTYESLVDRARREAVLRLKEQAVGADVILNLRIDTATISETDNDRGAGAIEVLASGTAVHYAA